MQLGLLRDEVRFVEYSSEWKKEFFKVKQEILTFTSIPESRIEHIGSTAIKEMLAKPILDIVIGVDNLTSVSENLFQGFKQAGFLRLRVQRPNEIILAKFTDETYQVKTHYVHLVEYNQDLWNNLIFFRDYLNTNETARNHYKEIKLKFIEEINSGIVEYTDYKEWFVKEIYEKRV